MLLIIYTVVSVGILLDLSSCFNIDTSTKNVNVYLGGNRGSYFGYSVALHRANGINWVLVGAPQNLDKITQKRTGAIYKCDASKSANCTDMAVDGDAETRFQDKTDQWMGATLFSGGEDELILACAPRYQDKSRYYVRTNWGVRYRPILFHGRCATIDGRTLMRKAFWNPCKQEPNWVEYGYCMAGMGVAYTSKPRRMLIIGLPGTKRGKGQLGIQYEGKESGQIAPTSMDRLESNELMGYTVVWGKISNKISGDIIGGAPRGSHLKGKVIIYKLEFGNMQINRLIENPDSTTKLGSYFGAALCAMDVNNDGWDDLLVGAPFYSSIDREEGKVYLFMNDGKGNVNLEDAGIFSLTGDSQSGARFGSSIADIGDLNADTYKDFAVGAPYGGKDGKGVVYIYHGGKNGLQRNHPVQKIDASDISGKPATFGHSISGGLDVDGNGFPDVVVGSYQDDKAFLFKTRPSLNLKGIMKLNTTTVVLSSKKKISCKVHGGKDYSCISFELCVEYNGQGTPSTIDIQTTLFMDKNQQGKKRAVIFGASNTEQTEVVTNITLAKGKKTCNTSVIHIRKTVSDVLSSIEIAVTLNYIEPAAGCGANQLCPVQDIYFRKTITEQVTYIKGCGDDNICQSDLAVTAKAILPKGNEVVFGATESFMIDVTVENNGENAFSSAMKVDYPTDVDVIGVKFQNESDPLFSVTDKLTDKNIKTLMFSLGNMFLQNKKLNLQIKFAPAKSRPSKKVLSFLLNVTTVSQEQNKDNNKKTININAALEADVFASGSVAPNPVVYGEIRNEVYQAKYQQDIGPEVKFQYLIQNAGPSPVENLNIRIRFIEKQNKEYLLYLLQAEVVGGTRVCKVRGDGINPSNITVRQDNTNTTEAPNKRKRREVSANALNCRTADCKLIECPIELLQEKKSKIIIIKTRLWQNTFIKDKVQSIDLLSDVNIEIDAEELKILRQPQNHLPDFAEVILSVIPPRPAVQAAKKEEIDLWILILAILGGVVLIIGTIFILYKVGFFKRNRKIKEITGPATNEEGDGAETSSQAGL